MFKKLLVVVCVALFLTVGVGSAMANGVEQGPPGWYERTKTNGGIQRQLFPKGNPINQSEWTFIESEDGDGKCGGCNAQDGQTAVLNPNGQAVKTDDSYSKTGWWGNNNDEAGASATGVAGFDMDLYANANGSSLEIVGWKKVWFFHVPVFDNVPNAADVEGFGTAKGKAQTWSYAIDTGPLGFLLGYTSSAGAGAYSGGKAYVEGSAFGLKGCDESITANLWIGGDVSQWNRAGETGYDGQFIDGGNSSFAGGLADANFGDNGQSYSILGYEFGGADISAGIKNYHGVSTQGTTIVNIDPYGSTRSFYGNTQNSANVNFGELNLLHSQVGGSGGLAAHITSGGSYANGTATFSYTGSTQGNGNANIAGSITPSSVFVSGSAHAVGN